MRTENWIAIFIPILIANIIASYGDITIYGLIKVSLILILSILIICIKFFNEVAPLRFTSKIQTNDESVAKIKISYYFKNKSKEDILIEGYFFRIFFKDKIILNTSNDGNFHSYGRIIEPSSGWKEETFDWVMPEEYKIENDGEYAFLNKIIYVYEGQSQIMSSACKLMRKEGNLQVM